MTSRPSAKKTLRQSKRRQLRNKSVKTRLTTETRKFERILERGDAQEAQSQLDLLTKLLQKAISKGVMRAGTAARKQARLQKHLNKLQAAGS